MNKLLQKVAKVFLGLSMAAGAGVAVSAGRKDASAVKADVGSAVRTCDFTAATTGNSNYTNTWTYASDFSVTGGANNNKGWAYCKFGGKGGSTTSATSSLTSNVKTGPITNQIAKFSVVIDSKGTDSNVTITSSYLYVYSDSGYSTQIDKVSLGTTYSSSGTLNATPTSGDYWAANSYYKWEITSTVKGKNNVGVCIDKLIWYQYTAPVQTYTVSFVVNEAGYGTVSRSSITGVPSGTSISTSNNTVTINGTTVTATATANTAQYTYAFTGWSNNTGTVTAARTITANFSRTTNTFTVNGSGVTNGTLSPTSNVSYGAEYTGTITPATDYTYPDSLTVQMGGNTLVADVDYLYDNTEGTLVIGSVTGNLVISGACVPEGTVYTVTYNANSGTVSPPSESVVENGHPSFPTPTRSGYHFKGWQVNGSGTAYFNSEDYTVTDDVTFVASWAAVYTVTFNANGGSSSPASQSVESGSTFTFPSAGTKTHYSFDGWTSTGSTPYYAAEATSPAVTGNITYTAHWTVSDAQYDVTYSPGEGGSGSFVDEDQWAGSYTLKAWNEIQGDSKITADSGYQFKNYTVGGVAKNPGDTITLSSDTTITVNFEESATFDFTQIEGFSEWGNGYDEHEVTYSLGTVTFESANRQTSTITNMPVTKGAGNVNFVMNKGTILSASFVLTQWSSKTKTVEMFYSTDGGETYTTTSTSSSDFTLTVASLPANTNAISMHFSETTNQVGIASLTITYSLPAALSSVEITDDPTSTFTQGETFSFDGELTAHYTKGKTSEVHTPTLYKYGSSGINPDSEGSTITVGTSLSVASHNGKYIYVGYTEEGVTKWASYQLTVNYAAVTSVTLSSNAETIAIGQSFSLSTISVTINPNTAQSGHEWIIHDSDGLVETTDYTFNGTQFTSIQNSADVVFWCRSTADNSKYAEFTLTVSGAPQASFVESSLSGFVDCDYDVSFTFANFSDLNKVTFTSINTSVADFSDGADMNTSTGTGSINVECFTEGSTTLSILYDSQSVASVTLTVSNDYVTGLTWTPPTIDVFSGATLSTSGWNVHYTMASTKQGDLTSGFDILLGDAPNYTEITSDHVWSAADNGKTLSIRYMGFVSPTTTTVTVTQTLNAITKPIPAATTTSTLTFTEACGGSGTSDGGEEWTITSDGTESVYDSTKGIHYGTSGASVQYINLTTSDFSAGKITSVVVNASTASGVSATVAVNIGGDAFGGDPQSLSQTATGYTFEGEVNADEIEVIITKPSSATKAIYCKSIAVTYSTPASSDSIANNASHKAAQRAAVKFANAFNAAMDDTENCTTGLDDAWSTCSSAYNTFKSEAADLGTTEEAWAKDLIKCATAQYSDDSGEACIERMMKTYEICVQKHGKTAFMSDLVSLGAPQVSPLVNIIGENTNTVAIIVIISMVSVTAIGGYFFLRKRKEQ